MIHPSNQNRLDPPPAGSRSAATLWLLDTPAWFFLGAAALSTAALIVKDFIRPRTVPLMINLIWIIVGACIGCLILLALLYPLAMIIEEIIGGAT